MYYKNALSKPFFAFYVILLQTKKDSMKFLESTKEEDIKLRYEIISSINDA